MIRKLVLILFLLISINLRAQYPKHCPNDGQFITWSLSNTQFTCSLAVLPLTYNKVAHQWLDSYTATTGLFTSSQPAFTDISGTISNSQLPNSGVTAGSYTSTNLTVNAQGIITTASNGSGGGGGSWTQISRQVLSTAAATVTFSNIASTFNHLVVIFNGRFSDSATNENLLMRFNGDTASNYDWDFSNPSNFTGVAQTSIAVCTFPAANGTAKSISSGTIWIPEYAGTTFFKSIHSSGGFAFTLGSAGTYGIASIFGIWRNTAAITSVTFLDSGGGNFVVGSSFTLYGVT